MTSIPPKRPRRGWVRIVHPVLLDAMIWQSESELLQAISSVDLAGEPELGIVVPSYHVSAVAFTPDGRTQRSCTDAEFDRVREAFQMDGADEDNHGRGNARHLWLAVGARVEAPCPCKEDEPTTADGPRLWRP